MVCSRECARGCGAGLYVLPLVLDLSPMHLRVGAPVAGLIPPKREKEGGERGAERRET